MMSRTVQSLRRFSVTRGVVSVTERKLLPRCLSPFPAQHNRIALPMGNFRSFSAGGSSDDDDPNRLFKDQMEELNDERQELYGFTEHETDSWTNSGQHKHETSFLEQIEQARRAERTVAGKEESVADPVSSEAPEWSVAGLSHLSQDGRDIQMVDIGLKSATQRIAVAQSIVVFPPEVMKAFGTDGATNGELIGPKGPIFATAKLAGIMAAK
jgi:hypothetical protein